MAIRASEQVARAVGASALLLSIGVVVLIRSDTESSQAWEDVGDLLLTVFLLPMAALLCVAALIATAAAVTRSRGWMTGLTWLLATPASVAGLTVVLWAATGASVSLD